MKKCPLQTDEELVKMYAGGANDAFEILLKRYKSRVYSYIFFNVRNREVCEDIFQETFVKAITTIRQGRYVENGKFLAWINRIAHNLIIDYFRRIQSEKTSSCEEFGYDLLNNAKLTRTSVEDELVHEQVLSDVVRLVEHLPDNQKEMIRMRFYENMSFKEISEKEGISINTALGRMRYAVINMRKIVKEKGVHLEVN